MRTRSLALVMAAVLLAPLPVAAQTRAAAKRRLGQGRDAAAHARRPPDLQGMWTNATYTPLQRPANLGTKAFYTDEELAEIEQRRLAQAPEATEPGTAADVHYDFGQFGLERSQGVVAPNKRTSLIVDPPDGQDSAGHRRGPEEGRGTR